MPRGAIAFTFPSKHSFRTRFRTDTRLRFSLSRRSNEAELRGGKKVKEREKGREESGDKKEQLEEQEEKARALIGFEPV